MLVVRQSSSCVGNSSVAPPTSCFIQRAEQAVPRLQALNPNVVVRAEKEKVEEKPDEYFRQFTVICATCCNTDTMVSYLSRPHFHWLHGHVCIQ